MVEYTVEVTLHDGTVAVWTINDDGTIDRVTDAIEDILGLPDTLHA